MSDDLEAQLLDALDDLNESIAGLLRQADEAGTSVHSLQYATGEYSYPPRLVAKAHVLSALALVRASKPEETVKTESGRAEIVTQSYRCATCDAPITYWSTVDHNSDINKPAIVLGHWAHDEGLTDRTYDGHRIKPSEPVTDVNHPAYRSPHPIEKCGVCRGPIQFVFGGPGTENKVSRYIHLGPVEMDHMAYPAF